MSVRPTTGNLHRQLLSLARMELVVKPCYYGLLMMRGLPEVWRASLLTSMNERRLQALYTCRQDHQEAANRKKEDLLTNQESYLFLWLKDYIRGLDHVLLELFLQFVTGTNTMPQLPVTVSINSWVGLNRVPRAHTCGAVLEISTAYTSVQKGTDYGN